MSDSVWRVPFEGTNIAAASGTLLPPAMGA